MIPPKENAEFVCHMEDVLDLYHEPYDPQCPTVCFDETSKQLVAETRPPRPAAPGQIAQYDYEYERNGVRNLFLFFEPLAGWRHIEVTERRTKLDWAHCMKELVDEFYPDAETLASEVAAWETDRNTRQTTANWRFTTDDARIKLRRLYPSLDD